MRIENFIIEVNSSDNKSLNRAYKSHIIRMLRSSDEAYVERWELYNIIIEELLSIGRVDTFNEIKYRVTDGEDVNVVILDILSSIEKTNTLHFMQRNIERFIEDDKYSRFFMSGCLN